MFLPLAGRIRRRSGVVFSPREWWERLAVASSKNSDASPPPADRRPVEIEGLQPSIPTELYVVAA